MALGERGDEVSRRRRKKYEVKNDRWKNVIVKVVVKVIDEA